MAELLLELFSEEIPARMQARAAEDLQRLVTNELTDAGLTWESAKAFASPRRLTLVVDGLPTETPDTAEERKGPRADAPEKAIEGFLKSVGMSRDQVEERDTGKGVVLFAVLQKTGRKTAEVIAESLPAVVHGLPWPKSMRWADGSLRWVRPLQSILGVFDGKALDVAIEGIKVSNQTRGHRFLAPEPFAVKDFADYKAKLQKAYVLLDAQDRKAKIMADAKLLVADAGLSLIEDNALLEEVAGLVEWPVALMGSFDPAFLDVPAEVLTATMRANQKYFSLTDPETGKLAPKFIVISNMETKDKGRAIVAGNERVLKARLSDAKFFWDQDLKIKLEDRVPALDGIVFHAKLGSVGDKVKRVMALAEYLAPLVGADVAQAKRAAYLSKADLVSGVVGEFPEVQGIMGRYYALRQGEPAAVADAIADHYSPKGPDDKCPTAPVSIAVALADKIDTLAGFFSIEEPPTGSKDPFALRRAGLGVIRIIIGNRLRIPPFAVIDFALGSYDSTIRRRLNDPSLDAQELDWEVKAAQGHYYYELSAFLTDRLKVQQRTAGIRHDLISAVYAVGRKFDLVKIVEIVEALQKLIGTEDGANLLAAYRRGSAIVDIEEKKSDVDYNGYVAVDLLYEPEEQVLFDQLQIVRQRVSKALASEDWLDAMSAVATLRAPIDAFFDKVTVNNPDPKLRENRLNLLAAFRATLSAVADFSKIEG